MQPTATSQPARPGTSSPADRILAGEARGYFRGRVAMYATLRALGIQRGDEVVLQAFTCLAVPSPVLAAGAVPRYADADPRTLNMDADDLARRITDRTRAIVVQHSFGLPADMPRLLEVARSRGLPVIEDCAHSLESRIGDRYVGEMGDAAFHSYEWGKPLVIGLGGTLLVNSESLRALVGALDAEFHEPTRREQLMIDLQLAAFNAIVGRPVYWLARDLYRWLGRRRLVVGSFRAEEFAGGASPDFSKAMSAHHRRRLQCALRMLHGDTSRRVGLATEWAARVGGLGLVIPVTLAGHFPVLVKYPLYVANKPEVLEAARHEHVEIYDMFATPVHPVHGDALSSSLHYEPGACPGAEWLAAHVVSLPMHARIDLRVMDRTAAFLSRHARVAQAPAR